MAEQEFYTSKYYTSSEIDQRLLQGLYDDAVKMGYPRSKTEFESQLASVVSSKRSSDSEELKDPYISLITEALRKTPQTLTEAEKTQVRENIDIPSTSDLTHLKLIIDGNTEASKVNFDAYETAVISPVQASTTVSGGKIVYVRNPNTDNLIANGFFYKVDGKYYRDANIGGTDVLIAYRAVDRTLYKNKKYICNGITYVVDGDFLVKPLSNIINENIGNISESVELINQQAELNFRNFSELGVDESAKMDGYEIALTKKTNTAEKTKVKVPVYDMQNPSATPVGLVDEIFVEDMKAEAKKMVDAEAERAEAKEQEIEGKVAELESEVKLLTFSETFVQGSYPSAYYSLGFGGNKGDILKYSLSTTGTVKYGFEIHGTLLSGGRELIVSRTTAVEDAEIVLLNSYKDISIVVAPKSEGDVIFKAAIKNTGYVVSGVVPEIKKDVESLLNPSKNVNFDHPLFSLVDDDFENVTRLNIFKNICDTIGIKVTFGVIPDLVDSSDYTGEVYLKEEKLELIKAWELQGFQFEYHPVHYLWYKSQSAGWDYVDNVVPEQAMVKVKRLFLQHGILNSNCLVYPGASSDHDALVEMIKKWVDYAVIAKGGVTIKGESKYKIRRLFLDFSETNTKSYYKEQIDKAVANNDWLIFGTHSAYYNQTITDADETSMSFVNLQEVLTYAASKAEFKTMKAAFEERKRMFADL